MKIFVPILAILCLGSLITVPAATAQFGWHIPHKPTTTPNEQRIYVYEVGDHGPNTAAFSLIDCSATGVSGPDKLGNCYVMTDTTGHFEISGLYHAHCSSDSSMVVLMGTEGDLTGGWKKGERGAFGWFGYLLGLYGLDPASDSSASTQTVFTNISLMPVTCGTLPTVSSVEISDRTTVAAAFALAPFANRTALPADGFSTKSNSLPALSSAFAAANALVSGLTGEFVVTDPATQEKINTIADVIENCVNSVNGTDTNDSRSNSEACNTLLKDASTTTTTPADTYQAILSMVQNPTNNVSTLFGLLASKPKWLPALSTQPSSWALSIPGAPTITAISTPAALVGDTLTITGTNLVNGSDTPVVVVGGVQATVVGTPTNGSITVKVPVHAISGLVGVYPGTYASNFVPFKIN